MSEGSTLMALTIEKINRLVLLLPPIREQHLISNLLDQKTTEIDDLIADKEKLIKLLEEKRQAVITEAVTKGLEPNVKMKDSGVEWIGEIPEDWEFVRIKYLTNDPLMYGANESAELDDKNLPRYIRITDLKSNGGLKEETFKSLPKEKAFPYMLKKGDLLFARSGATVGKVYLHESNLPACFAGYLIRYKNDSKKINGKYLYYFTQSYSYKTWIKLNTIQATIQNVSAEKYKNLTIPKPKMEEQTRIVEYLNNIEKQIQETIRLIDEQILKLKSYRQSIIYEAVTGKIDVQEVMNETEQEEVSSS